MRRRRIQLCTLGLTGMILLGIAVPPSVMAGAGADLTAEGAGRGTTYAEAGATVKGNRIQFVKTLTMDTEAHVPNVQFFYTLSTPESVSRDEEGTVRDYSISENEYRSAKTAVKEEDGSVSFTELYSGGDSAKVKGQPLFVTNTDSPASSTYKNPPASSGNGSVSGGTTGVVTFYSGGDGNLQKAGGQLSAQAYQPSSYGNAVYPDSPAKKYQKETATTTALKNTFASGDGMKKEGVAGNSGSSHDQGSISRDYINGAGNGGSVNSGNSRTRAVAAGKKYAYANVALDFSDVEFFEPGVYRWVITESVSDEKYTKKGITDDIDRTRILDVYISDQGDGRLGVSGYVMHNEGENPQVPANAGADLTALNDTKPDGYANDYETENLTLKKTVTGNQGSRDTYFKFTVKLSNMLPGTVCDVNLSPTGAGAGLMGGTAETETNNTVAVAINGADETTDKNGVNQNAHKNPRRLVAGDDGKLEAVFWLQHNQEIQISGLSKNTAYVISEDAEEIDREGYVPSAVISGDRSGTVVTCEKQNGESVYQASDTAISNDSGVVFTNHRSGIIPTGIIVGIIPGMLTAAAGMLGILVIGKKRHRKPESRG